MIITIRILKVLKCQMEIQIQKSIDTQNKILDHLRIYEISIIDIYSEVTEITGGYTTNGSGYTGWDFYVKFTDAEYGSKEALDSNNMSFETFQSYEKLVEKSGLIERALESYHRFKKNPNTAFLHRLKPISKE